MSVPATHLASLSTTPAIRRTVRVLRKSGSQMAVSFRVQNTLTSVQVAHGNEPLTVRRPGMISAGRGGR